MRKFAQGAKAEANAQVICDYKDEYYGSHPV